MSTVLQQPSSIEFSATIPDYVFGSSAHHSIVSIDLTMSGNTKTIFREKLYPDSDGHITLDDLSSLVEPYLKACLNAQLSVTISEYDIDDHSLTTLTTPKVSVLLATVDVGEPADVFVSNHFLTLLNGPKITAMGREERVYAYGHQSVMVTGSILDGHELATRRATLTSAATTGNISAFFVSPSDIEALLGGSGTLVSYEVTADAISQQFLVTDDPVAPAPSLCFINSFGCAEFIHCVGTHQKDSKYTRSSTRMRGMLRNYRIVEDRQFKANTGWLNEAMADWADDLFRSREVYLWVDGTIGREVAITDSTSTITNEDAHMPSFDFTYVYAQRLHNVMQRSHAGRVFDNTFDHTFA